MQVFISWSGNRSLAVAKILRDFLPTIIQMVRVMVSTDDLQSGTRWFSEIRRSIEESDVGVLCITRDNFMDPWMTFEAGVLSKSAAVVIPYLVDLSPVDLAGPIIAFQTVVADREGTFQLLQVINRKLEDPLSEERLGRAFERFWPDFEYHLQKLPPSDAPTAVRAPTERAPALTEEGYGESDRALFKEILARVKKIEERGG